MTRIDIREIDLFIKVLKESKEALELHLIQSKKAHLSFSNEPKLTGVAWGSTKNHFRNGYGPLLETFDTTAQILTEQFSSYTFAFFQEVTGGYPVLDTAQLQELEIRMQQLASYKAQWLLDMADDLAGIPGLGKFFGELSLESTTKEVILLRKFQEFEFYHRNDFDEVAEALHFLKEGLEAVGNKKNFQGDNKGFSMASYANERWFEKLSKFNEDNKDKVAFIKKADATTAAAVAEQTAQIHNAQMNMNQMGDAIMNEVNSNKSYQYNPLGGKSWFKGEAMEIKKNSNSNIPKANDLGMSKTVSQHSLDIVKKGTNKGDLSRPYVDSKGTNLLVQEIMDSGTPVKDSSLPNGLRWDVSGQFNGKGQGNWELVINLDTNTIVHFNFTKLK